MKRYKHPPERWKATLSFWGTVLLAATIFSLLATGLWAEGLVKLNPLGSWQSAVACCQEILSRYHLLLAVLPIGFIWLSIGMLCIGFLYACSRSIRNLWTTRRFLHRLPRVDSRLKYEFFG